MRDPEFDNTRAVREGWAIFDCDGSENGRWQLCRVDDPAAWPEGATDLTEPAFPGDGAAWTFVADKAKAGSAYHQAALDFIRERNPAEFAAIATSVKRSRPWKSERRPTCEGSGSCSGSG
jgi:hypothetical protein